MKRIILSCALLAACTIARAQASADVFYGDDATNVKKTHYKPPTEDNEFANTEMSMSNRTISFSDLPGLTKPTWAIITNGDGEQVKQMRVSKDNNTIDIHHLQQGTYFVTLVYKNKSKKAFVLEIGK